MNEQAQQLSSRPYITHVQLVDDDGQYYFARHPEIEGAFSTGETPEDALNDLQEVTTMIIEHLLEHGLPVPEPRPFLCYLPPSPNAPESAKWIPDTEPSMAIEPLRQPA